MSRGITHFAFGSTVTAIIVALVPDVPYPRTLVLVGGAWGLVPDAVKLVRHPILSTLHEGPIADMFWFHRTFDRFDVADSVGLASVSLAIFIGVTSILERRSYRAPETVRDRVPD
ncbi:MULTISPECIES: metal-dependent hydrolase [Natrialbaceae]|uniref:hypothetical protein n=1 Tax=Natrialbaceae TaxID=1644061 RepID=UPI00207D1053|nr:hypothetical protein [Natronococcus sp. CG52]